MKNFWAERVGLWCRKLERLAKFAESQPHAALWGFRRLRSEWRYAMGMEKALHREQWVKPLVKVLRERLVPALFGGEVSDG